MGVASAATLLGTTPAALETFGFLITACLSLPTAGQIALLVGCASISLAGLGYLGHQAYHHRSQLFFTLPGQPTENDSPALPEEEPSPALAA